MSATAIPRVHTPPPPDPPVRPAKHYINATSGLASWLLTVDHKRITILYLISITIFFAIGGFFAMLVRLELITPQGDLMTAETYNRSFSMHGIAMVFFFLIPSIPATLGNFLVPIMCGARDLAFPKINLLSWYCFIVGAVFALATAFMGGVDTGWTFYTPYSSTYANGAVLTAILGAFFAGFSSILTGLNFIVTIHKMRAPGLTWFRMPLFLWAMYATSIIQILGTPVVAITLILVGLERGLGFGFFDPKLGGDPILMQHLFWFYSHPAVYVMILPPLGVMSELTAAFCRRRVYGYHFVALSSVAIAVISFIVWGHHLFTSGQSVYAGMVFSVLTFLVGIPSAIKVFNWMATMFKASISFEAPMIYAFGFIGLFTIGGVTGLFLATLGLDIHMHDTYFVVAHFHYIMVGSAIFSYMGGLHYWWPKITGKLYNDTLGCISAVLIFLGFNATFFPQFILGYMGMPRRYHAYPAEFQFLNICSSLGATLLAVGYVLPAIYFTWSLFKGKDAGPNPFKAKGLEWEIPSPPPTENFTKVPVVNSEPYDYAPGAGH
ncbi:MAG: cytochrome c oxidase subunit I [Acidobacteria bacterium]|nr:cytochrome c oxidase subunit I [Acidobacteriota bacterium]